MQLYNNSDVRINSALTDLGAYCKKLEGEQAVHGFSSSMLYFFARGLDIRLDEKTGKVIGDGKVVFNINDAALCLGKTINTIKDYLVNGVRLGFFRYYKRVGNTVTVYYASLHSIAARYGLDGLGVFADIPMIELKHLKYWGTQLTTQSLQGASRHLAKEKLPKNEKVAQPEDLLTTPIYIQKPPKSKSPNAAKLRKQNTEVGSGQEQEQWARNVVYRSERYTYVDSHFTMFGVSQERIAREQQRSVSTVYRRLNNNGRHWIGNGDKKRERGIDPLPQTQIAQFKQGGVSRSTFNELKALEVDLKQEFLSGGAVWKASTNVYERQFQIYSAKSTKYWFKRKLESGQLDKYLLVNQSNTPDPNSLNSHEGSSLN